MKRVLTTELLDLDGTAMTGRKGALTLREVCVEALLGNYADEPNLAGEEKYKRFTLADRLSKEDETELSAEETAQLKKLIGKAYVPLAVGRAYQLLEA